MTNNDGKNLPPSLLVTKGVNKFGSLLFKDLEKSKNLVFSPFSLSTALAMLTPGAKDKTLAQVVPSCFQESHIKNIARIANAFECPLYCQVTMF